MQISEIILKDFKIFEGKNRLVLPEQENGSNLVLIGGMNGTGKTSILEAVKLCLYGKECKFLLENGDKYTDFVLRRFNKNAVSRGEKEFFVELSFLTRDIGQPSLISIRRTWVINGDNNRFKEDLKVFRDKRLLEYIGSSNWQDYIHNLIPQGAAQFFFFDGEKIKRIAESQDTKVELKEAIRSLLNIELYSTLRADLKNHIRNLKKMDSFISEKLKEVEVRIEETKIKLNEAKNEKNILIKQLGVYQRENQDLEEKLRKEAGKFANERDELIKEKAELIEQIQGLTRKLESLCGGLLPFANLSELTDKLRIQLEKEQVQKAKYHIHSELELKKQEVISRLFDNKSHFISKLNSDYNIEVLRSEFEKIWGDVIEETFSQDSLTIRHDLSVSDTKKAIELIEQARGKLRKEIEKIINQRGKLIYRRRKVTEKLTIIRPGTAADETFDKIKQVSQKIGKQLGLIEECNNKINELQKEIIRRDQQNDRLIEKTKLVEKIQKKVILCENVRDVLQKFIDRMTREKLSVLGENATKMFKSLATKDDLIDKISIDQDTFEVKLIDKKGNEKFKGNISAGEKEIFAISLLWGLLKASGKELPIMIDTPLAHLDTEHRNSIITKYLPTAGTQVIVLSTDSEVDKEYYSLISPYVSKSFTLKYNPEKKCSTINAGYFFDQDNPEEGTINAVKA